MIDKKLKPDYSTARIKVGYQCNNNCIFCNARPYRSMEALSMRDIAGKVMLAKKIGFKRIQFSGGEPTLHHDLPKLIALTKKLNLDAGIITNGRRLANKDYLGILIKAGLSFVQLSLHGNKTNHDFVTRADSFDDTMQALKLLHEAKLNILVNMVVTKSNINSLISTAKTLTQYSPLTFKADFIEPLELEGSYFEELCPDFPEASKAAKNLLSWAENSLDNKELIVTVSGLPLCAILNQHTKSYDIRRTNLAEDSEVFDAGFNKAHLIGKIKTAVCDKCRLEDICPGVYEEYIRRNTYLVQPESGPVSNSFVYRPDEIQFAISDSNINTANCPILSGELEIEQIDCKLILQDKTGARLYHTESADFTSEQRARIKALGQIYLDVSGEIYHQDFELEMQQLESDEHCRMCTKFNFCPAIWSPRIENSFTKAEQDMIRLIDQLKGSILDVGGGPVRYEKQFNTLLHDKAIEYSVVEPDPGDSLLGFLDKHNIRQNLFKGRIEDFPVTDSKFDWILVLRSHNHFVDLNLAYDNIFSMLKPGGKLLLVDNVAYGLLRSETAWDNIKSRSGSEAFEHFNNHESHQAIDYVNQSGLKLLEHHPVDINTANQWWCIFERPVA